MRRRQESAPVVSAEGFAVIATNVRRRFNDREVLRDVNLTIEGDEFVALLGRSGTGKSTLLRILGGLDTEYEGDVLVPERRAVVFQEARLIPWQRVLANVLLGLRPGEDGAGALKAKGLDALGEVELALARALVREPQLMLLDEPFGALDALTRIKMHALLQRLCERHRPAVLLVTHDVDEALLLADRAVVLVDGAISLDVRIDLERPRDRGDAAFVELRHRLLRELGVEERPPRSTVAPSEASEADFETTRLATTSPGRRRSDDPTPPPTI